MEANSEKRQSKKQARLAAFGRSAAALLLCLAFLLPVLSLAQKDRAFSDQENRPLAQRPALTWDGLRAGTFFADASDWLSDQLWGRDGWIALDTFGLRLLGLHDVNGVYLGRDGRLFAAPETPDPDRAAKKLAAVNGFADRHPELSVTMLLVPGAAAVQPDMLPKNAPVRDQLADVEAVRRGLSSAVHAPDAAAALREHAGEYIFYRTDHHWTTLGAYCVFLAAADVLAAPGQGIPAFDVLTVSDSFEGTLASRAGVHRTADTIEVFLPQNGPDYYVSWPDSQTRSTSLFCTAALEEKDQYTLFLGGNHPLVEIHTTADSGRGLLIFKDSYANSFVPFLTSLYDTVVLVDPRYYYGDLSTVMSSYGITDVLFLYSADTWATDAALTDLLATD